MKKITDFFGGLKITFIITVIFFATATSCSSEKQDETKLVRSSRRYEVYTEKVDGHDYLIFLPSSSNSGIHALHSESCPCKNKK